MITLRLTDTGKVVGVKFGSKTVRGIKKGSKKFPKGKLPFQGKPIIIKIQKLKGDSGGPCRMIGTTLYCPP